jgi:hypothetical protein
VFLNAQRSVLTRLTITLSVAIAAVACRSNPERSRAAMDSHRSVAASDSPRNAALENFQRNDAAANAGRSTAPWDSQRGAVLDAALTRLVSAHRGWHLGTPADSKNKNLAHMLQDQPGYAPYRASGDFNHDGIGDAAVVLVRGDSGLIYWFKGEHSGFAKPHLIGGLDWAREGGLFVSNDALSFGMFYSDVSFGWVWDSTAGALRVAKRATDSSSE